MSPGAAPRLWFVGLGVDLAGKITHTDQGSGPCGPAGSPIHVSVPGCVPAPLSPFSHRAGSSLSQALPNLISTEANSILGLDRAVDSRAPGAWRAAPAAAADRKLPSLPLPSLPLRKLNFHFC